jgi:hypothetical protein
MAVPPRPHPCRQDARIPSLPVIRTATQIASAIGARLRLTDHYAFDDRVTGAPTVVCLVAGQKFELWNYTLPKLRAAARDVDVCIATPGRMQTELREICAEFTWSYLGTATNDASLAQNICYRLHSDAATIVKLDDDILLLRDTIAKLVDDLYALQDTSVTRPGFLSPVLPLHADCYRWVLERLGRIEEFDRRFGPDSGSNSDTALEESPEAARWIWRTTAPLETTADRLPDPDRKLLTCDGAHRLGIMAFERSFWESIGYLPVHRGRLVAGLPSYESDEAHIVAQASVASRPGYITSSAFAGRFAHPHQYPAMLKLLQAEPRLFGDERASLGIGAITDPRSA